MARKSQNEGRPGQPLEQLAELAQRYGGDENFIIAAGGNVSFKTDETIYVTPSGSSLATVEAENFVALERAKLDALLAETGEEMRENYQAGMLRAKTDPECRLAPSIESVMHNFLPAKFTVHTHPTVVNAVSCAAGGGKIIEDLFGEEVLLVPFAAPGFEAAHAVASAVKNYRQQHAGEPPRVIILEKHGLIVTGDNPREVTDTTERIVSAVKDAVQKAAAEAGPPFGELLPPADRRENIINTVAPALRVLLAEGDNPKIVTFDDSEPVMKLVSGSDGPAATELGPVTPHQVFYCGGFPLWFEPREDESRKQTIDRLGEAVGDYRDNHGGPPIIVLVRGLGMFAAGDDYAQAEVACSVYKDSVKAMAGAAALGGMETIGRKDHPFITSCTQEARDARAEYRGRGGGKAAGKVAVITGAAQGFGLGIAGELAGQGAHVVLADVNAEGAEQNAQEFMQKHGPGRAMGLAADVTDAESVRAAVHSIVKRYGGFDIFVSNAGVLRAGSVKTLPIEQFRLVTEVNYVGYFICVQAASPVMAAQHMANPGYTGDIIQINSKSGLAGSNRNSAYAGGKFGGIGLTQSFALELIRDGIKVNSICPGNFYDGPLWSDPENGLFVQYLRAGKVPGAKTVEDVRKAYEAKSPIHRGCTVEDVMRAIYYVIEQDYETGQAVPVTGGQIMLR